MIKQLDENNTQKAEELEKLSLLPLGRKRGLKFPFEALFPLDDIVIGEHNQLDPFELWAKHNISNLVIS